MKLGREVLYLSNADIESCGLPGSEVERVVEAMFSAKASGAATLKPKLALHASGPLFLASPGLLSSPSCAGLKWVAVAENQDQGLPHIAGIILLSDGETGMPVAIMDAAWITGVRTAAITAIAARHLARPDSASIGFVACGLQARTHLSALLRHFPIRRIRAYSRRFSSAERFAHEARERGLAAEPVSDPSAAVEDMDIVITTTPIVPRTPPFLDAAWLSSGSFAGIVDMGVSWITSSLATLDLAVTDDVAQAASEKVNYPKPYDGEVAHLVAGLHPGRRTPQQRTALIFAGLGLADVAVGAAVYARALEKSIGRVLPL